MVAGIDMGKVIHMIPLAEGKCYFLEEIMFASGDSGRIRFRRNQDIMLVEDETFQIKGEMVETENIYFPAICLFAWLEAAGVLTKDTVSNIGFEDLS
jgi:hypothetical protein